MLLSDDLAYFYNPWCRIMVELPVILFLYPFLLLLIQSLLLRESSVYT